MTDKPRLVFRAPVLTASGYGEHSRQVLKAILATDLFDVSVIATNWGQTPFLHESNEFINHVRMLSNKFEVEKRENRTNYDYSVQVTIANEFQKLARVNVGVTAGIESTEV